MFNKIALAITGLSALVMGLPTKEPTAAKDLVRRFGDSYTKYNGDGSINNGWPAMANWGSYDQLWNQNLQAMRNSCAWNGWGANNSEDEINNINWAIGQLSGQTGIDKRFILVIMMQESKGCVRVPTTSNGVRNPGLMQSHNGSGSCQGVNPCPWQTIEQMIRDGTAGTSSGDGIQQTYNWSKGIIGDLARTYYVAARKYNSGSVDFGNLGNGLGSTNCYASDIANRLTGWSLAGTSCW
ncbi:muramidase [Purpureocillium lavendulum]|uniref:Muramidase n=1 Tax=Purpureocillium lavendulum TaxID=1247861 RepID=A0AB34G1U2_9HYPO|nr:muramidase [Purpureocillium lavendulum]